MSASERIKSSARRGFGVAPSPLNGVKRDLALVLLGALLLLLVVPRLAADMGMQLLLLAGYGVLSALWVVIRTRRVLAVLGGSDGPKQE